MQRSNSVKLSFTFGLTLKKGFFTRIFTNDNKHYEQTRSLLFPPLSKQQIYKDFFQLNSFCSPEAAAMFN